jgi:hypothetical protein
VKVRKAIVNLLRVIADEVERNPDFERRVAAALGLEEQPKAHEQRGMQDELPEAPAGERPKNRRPPPVLDPVEVARSGEDVLRTRLAALSIEQLKDIVADFGMDPGKLVIKWKTPDRIIDRIVEIAVPRAQKGDAFRSDARRDE